jgi:membrane protein YdbS with pleckstrin-like domain
MSEAGRDTTGIVYAGVWSRLTAWLDVPREPPSIPFVAAERADEAPPPIEQVHPDPGYLRYLRLWFWIGLAGVVAPTLVAGGLALAEESALVTSLVGVLLGLMLLIAALIWIGLRLRYDTTWFVLTDRSLRVRRGVWVIREMTVTFENVQNVRLMQGPIERAFGIRRLLIETAGGGGASASAQSPGSNACMMEGLADAERIRDLIMARVRASKSAGLGDAGAGGEGAVEDVGVVEAPPYAAEGRQARLKALQEVRDEARALADWASGR